MRAHAPTEPVGANGPAVCGRPHTACVLTRPQKQPLRRTCQPATATASLPPFDLCAGGRDRPVWALLGGEALSQCVLGRHAGVEELVEVVGAAGLGADAAHAVTAERLATHDG